MKKIIKTENRFYRPILFFIAFFICVVIFFSGLITTPKVYAICWRLADTPIVKTISSLPYVEECLPSYPYIDPTCTVTTLYTLPFSVTAYGTPTTYYYIPQTVSYDCYWIE